MTPIEALAKGAVAVLGRPLGDRERDNFSKYLTLLRKWQKAQRLVGSDEPMWIVEHLFLDSLLFLRVLPSGVRSLVDLGSGAGLPGLPLKIVRPDLEVLLIESRRRRAMFLTSAIRELGLDHIRVLEGRAESHLDDLRQKFDAAVMRCAGDADVMMAAAAELVPHRGIVIAAGPPKPRPLALGRWVLAPGLKPGTTRRFALYQVDSRT